MPASFTCVSGIHEWAETVASKFSRKSKNQFLMPITALKLIRNILQFGEIISMKLVQEFVIVKIVNQHLLLKLDNLPKVV